MWDTRKLHDEQLASYVRTHKPQIEAILSDYAARKKELEEQDLTVDTSWDIGDQPVKEVMGDLLLRLLTLPPGATLALVAHHQGDKLPDGTVHITTEDGLRRSAGTPVTLS